MTVFQRLKSYRIQLLSLIALLSFLSGDLLHAQADIQKYSKKPTAKPTQSAPATPPASSFGAGAYSAYGSKNSKFSKRRKRSVSRNPRRVKPRASDDGTIDLNALDSTPAASAPASNVYSNAPMPLSGSSSSEPQFKMVFDTYLAIRPGVDPITFRSFHTLLLVEFAPNPDFQFGFEVNPTPRYYELDYNITPKLQIRVGRIWIPFDDLNPHNSFGGRVNTSPLSQDGITSFLPDIWADLGVGVRYQLLETNSLAVVTHAYIVNGFTDDGRDPRLGTQGDYPDFSNAPTLDNNGAKSVGARLQTTFFNRMSFGASMYTGRYTDEDKETASIFMWGADSQLRFGAIEVKVCYISMNSSLLPPSPEESFTRGGVYGEGSVRLNEKVRVRVRAGISQLDERVLSVNDQTIIGADVSYNFGLVELGAIHNRDLNTVTGKQNYTFTALRMRLIL